MVSTKYRSGASMKSIFLLTFGFFASTWGLYAQKYSHQDSLRGSITPERAWWDLKFYHLDVKVEPADSSIEGSVEMVYKVLDHNKSLQVDLQPPLQITKVTDINGIQLKVKHDGNAHFIQLDKVQEIGTTQKVIVYYQGRPKVAVRPPWDGGFSWDKDEEGNEFIHTNCQGIGASIWWPNKDHLYDEPDSMLISVNVPGHLMDVSNGRLRQVDTLPDGTKTYHWFVSNPISNYVVNINIANYSHFAEVFKGEKGDLTMDYYVLPYHLNKAVRQFQDAPKMMKAFEHWFGPYPFYEDGYKLVEVPSTGMEHQSSVTYGNRFENGYKGRDYSGTGWGMKFDFIIIHESGHEWFANNITYQDIADMWVHESFTNYSESLFIEYYWGKEAGQSYVRGNRQLINNDSPIIGDYHVNNKGSGDMYPKGGNLLNTLRTIIDDDQLWRDILRGLNKSFYHQTVNSSQIENYISQKSNLNLAPFFNQYLRDVRIPVLEYYFKSGELYFRWNNTVPEFDMPVKTLSNKDKDEQWIYPKNQWQQVKWNGPMEILTTDPNLYMAKLKITEY